MIHEMVTLRLDYGNDLYMGQTLTQIWKLPLVQNSLQTVNGSLLKGAHSAWAESTPLAAYSIPGLLQGAGSYLYSQGPAYLWDHFTLNIPTEYHGQGLKIFWQKTAT